MPRAIVDYYHNTVNEVLAVNRLAREGPRAWKAEISFAVWPFMAARLTGSSDDILSR